MSEKISEDEIFRLGLMVIGAIVFAIFGGALMVLILGHFRPTYFSKSNFKKLIQFGIPILLAGVLGLLITKSYLLDQSIDQPLVQSRAIKIIAFFLSLWSFAAGLAILFGPFWVVLFRKNGIRVGDFKSRSRRPRVVRLQQSSGESFIGWSLKSGEEIFLSQKDRTMHTLIAGSTGSGKTTLLESLYMDAMKNQQSVLIIDPKGNIETLTKLKNIAIKAGYKEERFFTLSIINPEISNHYNPIEAGTIMQKVNRIMGALQWSEPFYKDQSFSWLIIILEVLKKAKEPITIKSIVRMGVDKKFGLSVVAKLKQDEANRELFESFNRVMKENLSNITGLLGQLQQLNNDEFGKIFEPSQNECQKNFSLESLLSAPGVAYFQLNVMAYEESAKALGKLILQDIKGLASDIHAGKLQANQKFFPIFIDEFGAFAIEGFIDFLKMCRDVGFANHLFFQSLADLDVVSESFKSQVQQNCLTKIIMRTDDPDEVDFWSSVAGTQDALESSYQVITLGSLKLRTGMGNARTTKQMFIEHDVFKQLNIGEAVLIQKAPFRHDLLQLWWPSHGPYGP